MKITSNQRFENLKFPDNQQYQGEQFSSVSVLNCDLSGAIFLDCKFKNCQFKNSDLSNFRLFFGTTFHDCIFENCDLRSLGLQDALFENCSFIKCDLRGVDLDSAKWNFCKIDGCKFRDISLHTWNCTGCVFSGVLRDVRFIGENKSKLILDLSNAKFDCVEFIDCDLSESIPPKDKNHYFVNELRKKVRNAGSVLNSKSEYVKKIVERRLNKMANMDCYIFNIVDMRKIEGDEVAETLMEILSIGKSV